MNLLLRGFLVLMALATLALGGILVFQGRGRGDTWLASGGICLLAASALCVVASF